jgi:hypothetical protein
MNDSLVFDAELYEPGSAGADGLCTHHRSEAGQTESCARDAVVSFQDADGRWQAGCTTALQELVEKGEIEPLGQGA